METTTTRVDLGTNTYAIEATVTHDGISHTAGGGFVSDDLIIAYCGSDERTLTLWDGTVIGRYSVVSRWKVDSWMSPYRYSIAATVNGKRYHGRTFGPGMCVTLRPYKTA